MATDDDPMAHYDFDFDASLDDPLWPWPWTVLGIAALLVFFSLAKPATVEPQDSASVLIVEHTYDGPVESAGALVRWQYSGGSMLVEWVDTTTDGVFRSGFEVAP